MGVTNTRGVKADVGYARGSVLGNLYAILGDPATALQTRIGNPDADTLVSIIAKWGDSPDTQALMHAIYMATPTVYWGQTALGVYQTAVNVTGQGMLSSINVYDDWGSCRNDIDVRVTIDGAVVYTWDAGAEIEPYEWMSNATDVGGAAYPSIYMHFNFPYRTSLLVEYRARGAGGQTETIAVHYTA